jgi:hypothetical protein
MIPLLSTLKTSIPLQTKTEIFLTRETFSTPDLEQLPLHTLALLLLEPERNTLPLVHCGGSSPRAADTRDDASELHVSADEDAVLSEHCMKDCTGMTATQLQAGLNLGDGQDNPDSNAPLKTLTLSPLTGHHSS